MSGGYGTVLVVRRQARDSDGDPTGAATDVVSDGWLIAPAGSTEDSDPARRVTTTRLQAYHADPHHDIGPGDRVWLAGDPRTLPPPWQVAGELERWAPFDDPFALAARHDAGGAVVTLQRAT